MRCLRFGLVLGCLAQACAADSVSEEDAPCTTLRVLVRPELGPAWEASTRDAYAAWSAELDDYAFDVVVSAEPRMTACTVVVTGGDAEGNLAITDDDVVTVNTAAPLRDDARTVLMTHEAGHTLGLGESTDPVAMMFPRINDRHATTIGDADRSALCVRHRCRRTP